MKQICLGDLIDTPTGKYKVVAIDNTPRHPSNSIKYWNIIARNEKNEEIRITNEDLETWNQ